MKFFIFLCSLGLILSASSVHAVVKCHYLFKPTEPGTGLPVYGIPHNKEAGEETVDGPGYLNLHLMKWTSEQGGLKQRLLSAEKDSLEPITEFTGESSSGGKQITIRALTELPLGRSAFKNKLGFGNSTGIRLKVSSWDPHAEIQIYFRENSVSNELRVATFRVGIEPTEIYIPWSDFHYENRALNAIEKNGKAIKFDDFGFRIQSTDVKSPDSKVRSRFGLRLHGPVVYLRDLRDPVLREQLLEQSFELDQMYNQARIPYERLFEGRNQKADKALLEKAMTSLYNPKIQRKVGSIPRSTILEMLTKWGGRFQTFRKKLTKDEFFGEESPLHTLKPNEYNKGRNFTETGRHHPVIPFETGEFAKDHSEIAHARQLVAMMWEMTAAEKQSFKGMYATFFGENMARWALWDILFDAPGNTLANSPRFWRDLEILLGTAEGE